MAPLDEEKPPPEPNTQGSTQGYDEAGALRASFKVVSNAYLLKNG